ncbi:hypothetical protein DITRI_Ditri17bG0134800 [Diplodiscus trichospermus]
MEEERKRFFSGSRRNHLGWRHGSFEVDWRASLFTVFINNLSRRVSRRALWEVFSIYGRVLDVFINFKSRKPATYAFVRYKTVKERMRTIAERNNRFIDGQLIMVKKVTFGRKERKQSFGFWGKKLPSHLPIHKAHMTNGRVHPSYKEILLGSNNSLNNAGTSGEHRDGKDLDMEGSAKDLDADKEETVFNFEV